MKLKIEKDIPIPPTERDTIWPWSKMEAGDSVRIPNGKFNTAQASARIWVKRHRPDLTVVSRKKHERIWFRETEQS